MIFRSIHLRNILSFRDARLELGPLNVLIGPNGSGKSNLLACLGLLQAAPQDLNSAVLHGGGAPDWLWAGPSNGHSPASIGCVFCPQGEEEPLEYVLNFTSAGQSLVIPWERLADEFVEGAPGRKIHFKRGGTRFELEQDGNRTEGGTWERGSRFSAV